MEYTHSHCGRKVVSQIWKHCPYCGIKINPLVAKLKGKTPTKKKQTKIGSPLACEATSTRGKNKGKGCTRLFNHKGAHRYG